MFFNQTNKTPLSVLISNTLIASIVALPLAALVWLSTQGNVEIWLHLRQTLLAEYISNTLILTLGVGICSLLLGVGSAWIIARFQFLGRSIIQWALLLPLAMPAYITAYSYTGFFDVAGPAQTFIRGNLNVAYGDYWFPNIHSLGGAIFVMSAVLYPYIYLLARSAFIEQSSSLQKSSQVLGYSHLQSFWYIALPIARPAIVAGLALTLMETLADYGTVAYFGVDTFTTGIFRAWFGMGSVHSAAKLSLLLLGFVLLLMALEQHSRRRAQFYEQGHNGKNQLIPLSNTNALLALISCFIPLLVGFIIPVSQLFIWTLDNFTLIFETSFLTLAFNSFSLAAITAFTAVVLAMIVSYTKRNSNNWLIIASHRTVLSGYAIPGTVIAVGIMIPLATFDKHIGAWLSNGLQTDIRLITSGTLFALIIAYLARFLSASTQTIDSGLKKVSPQIEQAARSLGFNKNQTLYRVHLPIISGSLLTAGLIVFVDVMKELPTTLVLRPFNFNTLAVKSFELASDEQLAEAAPAALAIVLFGLIPVILLSFAIDRKTH